MYLKRLELQGFKSFADKTVLDFSDGITAVVGPNGSGKSNISDAVRWVLGEMSAKTLRGSNMQDVIFSGTQTRKQVNFAEVSLVLDNSDRMFPIEFDEIVVTRKVFRSGETSYQINRSECRLKDIHELFMDTGLGRDGYSMIGQGNVAQILSTKADDRRAFFEEAAGVAKYKHRKDEALRKLTTVNDNLLRLNDITNELESQLAPLENQSKKARRYMVLYDEYKGLDVSMCLINIEKNARLLSEANALYNSVSDEINDLKSKETEIEAVRDELYLKSAQKDEEQANKNNELLENEAKSMACSNDISIAENNIKNNELSIVRIDEEILQLDRKTSQLNIQIQEHLNSIAERESHKNDLISGFDEIQSANTQIFERIAVCRSEIDNLKNELLQKNNERASVNATTDGIEKLRSTILERREAVETEIKNHGSNIDSIRNEAQKNRKSIEELKEKADAMRTRVETQNSRLLALQDQYDNNEKKLAALQVDMNSKTSQKKMLEGMENDYEGFSGSVKAVMTAPELKKCDVFGTVSGLISVAKKYVTAIEIALGGAMQNIVVETEDDAKEAIAFLKRSKSGRATFLPVGAVNYREFDFYNEVSKCEGFVDMADRLIDYDKKYTPVMKNLLCRVVVADNIDNAVKIAKKFSYKFKIVTLTGELLSTGGSISGGSVNKTTGFLSRSAQIKTLGEEISVISKEIGNIKKENTSLDADISNVKNNLSSFEPLLREYENDILVCENTLKHLENTLQNSDQSEKELKDEFEKIEKQLSESADEIAENINLSSSLRRECDNLSVQIEEKEVEFSELSQLKDSKADELMSAALNLKNIEKDIENERESIHTIETSISDNEALKIKKAEDREQINAKNKELKVLIEDKNKEIDTIKAMSDSIKKEIEDIAAQKQAIVDGLKDITTDNKDLTDRLIVLQQELSKAEAKQIRYENDSENIITRLWDEYELTPSSAEEIKIEIDDISTARTRVAELKGKIKALGSVNLDSIDEYVKTKERFDFLTQQKNDLEKSQDNLSKVIASMQELMEEHFKQQFAQINKAFSRVFSELFGGGRGRLYLSEPDDIMESGIEIEVQLPGKGLQNINLYSGGEKSFIAIALLFAILEVKPTPFCILDEIDAALDDLNVSRFATYLKNYLTSSQFIVITHRRGTMESSNIMYGVTMQEKGVSKLLTLQIDDVEDELLDLKG